MEINFKPENTNTILNKVFLSLEYMSGDADAYDYEEIELNGVTFDNYKEKIEDTIEPLFNKYKLLSEITDCNSSKYIESDYEEVKKIYGDEIADLYEICPGDSTVDGQWNAHLCSIDLIAYDALGIKYTSNLQ